MKQQSAGSWHYRTVGHDDLLLAVFRPAYRPGTQPAGRSYFFDKANGSPLSSAAATGFTLSGLAMRQPGGGSSRTMPRRRSPAVVIAATPPVISAIARAKALPPRWPPSKGTATEPSSVNRDNRRLFKFGSEQRCHRADQDAAGAYADNRASSFE